MVYLLYHYRESNGGLPELVDESRRLVALTLLKAPGLGAIPADLHVTPAAGMILAAVEK
jgi:hypothetical protein